MDSFPSPIERTVASALLLLSTPPSELIDEEKQGKSKSRKSLSLMLSSESKSCISSLTAEHLSSRKKKLSMIAAVSHRLEIKFKAVKKKRSKIYWITDFQNISSNMPTEASCMSSISSSSGISSARSQYKTTKAEKFQVNSQRKRICGGSTHMWRRAEAILKLLSGGCFSEVNIRRMLGDSPDTSKAIRIRCDAESSLRSDGLKWIVQVVKAGRIEEIRNRREKRPFPMSYSIATE